MARPAGHLPPIHHYIEDSLAESSWRVDAAQEGVRRWLSAATVDSLIASRIRSEGVCRKANTRNGSCCSYHEGMIDGFHLLIDLAEIRRRHHKPCDRLARTEPDAMCAYCGWEAETHRERTDGFT